MAFMIKGGAPRIGDSGETLGQFPAEPQAVALPAQLPVAIGEKLFRCNLLLPMAGQIFQQSRMEIMSAPGTGGVVPKRQNMPPMPPINTMVDPALDT